MNKLTIALAALLIGLALPSVGQGGKPMQMHAKMPMQAGSMDMMHVAMMGLSPSEKRVAMMHMQKMTPAEHAVIMKRATLCMHDPHKDMMKHMNHPTEAMKMQHMMSGLNPGEQKTMRGMWTKMSPKERMVGEKMMMNFCMYGMKHSK